MKKMMTFVLVMMVCAVCAQAEKVKLPVGREKACSYGQYYENREKPAPILDVPLRHPHILRGPDGVYYLTGTTSDTRHSTPDTSPDFHNNDGIYLWKSTNLTDWVSIGQVFDMGSWGAKEKLGQPFWRAPTVDPDVPFGPTMRGVHAPEIHYLKGTFYIVFSINRQGVSILKSMTGKAEGPYELLTPEGMGSKHNKKARPIVYEGGSPSLFEDNGTVYLLWGRGFIAPLNEDMNRITEEPKQLLCAPGKDSHAYYPRTVGQRGFSLFKADGKYWLTAEQITFRDQISACDVFVASSDTLFGPYSRRRWMIPHAGETTIFNGPPSTDSTSSSQAGSGQDGEIYAAYCGNDEESAFTDRAGIVPLKWTEENPGFEKWNQKFLRVAAGVHTERGCWDEISHPVTPYSMRDVQCILGHDGYYYYTGSCDDPHFAGRLAVFKSKDLVNWEEKTILTLDEVTPLSDVARAAFKEESAKKKGRGLIDKFMDCEVHYVKGTYYFIYAFYGKKNNNFPPPPEGQHHRGVFYMRSTSGTMDGPWEQLGKLGASQGSFFEDDDGSVYTCAGQFGLGKMADDMIGGRQGDFFYVLPAEGTHALVDVGACLVRMFDTYVYFSCGYANNDNATPAPYGDDGISSYNYSYMVADAPMGAYSRARLGVDYGGHGGVFQDAKGRWWAAFFGTMSQQDFRRHWWGPPGVVPLEVTEQDGMPVVRVAKEAPPEFAEAMAKKEREEKSY